MSDLNLKLLKGKSPVMNMAFFLSTDKALRHIRNHLLSNPEFKGWDLLLQFRLEQQQNKDAKDYEDLVGGLEFRKRAFFSDQIYRNDPQNAQEIYDAYADLVEYALSQALALNWYSIHEDLLSAFSPLGILIYANFNKENGHWICQTAYLPGLGNPKTVVQSKEAEDNHLLTREIHIEPIDTITPRAIESNSRRRHRLDIEIKYRPKSLEERIYYEIYKISFKKIREKALNRPMVATLSAEEEKIHIHDLKLYQVINHRLLGFQEWNQMVLNLNPAQQGKETQQGKEN